MPHRQIRSQHYTNIEHPTIVVAGMRSNNQDPNSAKARSDALDAMENALRELVAAASPPRPPEPAIYEELRAMM